LSPECRKTRTGYLRNSLVVWIGDDSEQFFDALNLNTAMCASGLFGGGATAAGGRAAGCDLDSSQWQIGTRSQWNITKDLYVGIDLIYHKVNGATFNAAGTATLTAGALPGKAASASHTSGDIDTFAATWRIHRDIVP
jgi:hypothetical protein